MKITAVCGWALPEEWFGLLVNNHFTEADVRTHYPAYPESKEDAVRVFDSKPDWIIGYSLGSLWLLKHKSMIPPQTKIILMAPILGFPAEKNLGGKTPLGKLKYQKKLLGSEEDYLDSLRGFFDLSGIRLPDKNFPQPYSRETLVRGLDFLETACVSPQAADNCVAITGLRDPLLDASQLKKLIPHLILIDKCDHSPHKMLSHLAENRNWADNSSPEPITSQRAL